MTTSQYPLLQELTLSSTVYRKKIHSVDLRPYVSFDGTDKNRDEFLGWMQEVTACRAFSGSGGGMVNRGHWWTELGGVMGSDGTGGRRRLVGVLGQLEEWGRLPLNTGEGYSYQMVE